MRKCSSCKGKRWRQLKEHEVYFSWSVCYPDVLNSRQVFDDLRSWEFDINDEHKSKATLFFTRRRDRPDYWNFGIDFRTNEKIMSLQAYTQLNDWPVIVSVFDYPIGQVRHFELPDYVNQMLTTERFDRIYIKTKLLLTILCGECRRRDLPVVPAKASDSYFSEEEPGDVTFLVGKAKKERMAHMKMLAPRSPIFAAKFLEAAKKGKPNVFEINYENFEAVDAFIEFFYGGLPKETKFKKIVGTLLELAHSYVVDDLKRICENLMLEFVSFNTADEYYYLANRCRCPRLIHRFKKLFESRNVWFDETDYRFRCRL